MPFQPHEQISTTARSAEVLAQRHGAENLHAFADSLPRNARVLDVGAGDSTFGHGVTGLRKDVEWISLDHDPPLDELRESAPDNLHYITGNATELTDDFAADQFSYIASYWLLPHLSHQERVKTLAGMYSIAAVGATLSVGPWTSPHDNPPRGIIKSALSLRAPAIQIEKQPSATVEEIGALVTSLATEICVPARVQRAHGAYQRSTAEILDTSRHFIRNKDTNTKMIYDPKTHLYVPAFSSPRGLRIMAAVLRESAREYRRNPTQEN
jgi:ubiquinone/menaquinone biosynthesis C-methylase UbiE